VPNAAFARRQAERDALLRRIEAALRADERVVAAWLAGSLGRGTADALSDIDLWVIVRDEAVDAVVAGPHAFVTGVGSPSLTIDVPQNAPPGGAYMFTHFPGETGAHQVDWYWQAASRATRPEGTALLFQASPVPPAQPRVTLAPAELQARLEEQLMEFWATVLVTAKAIGRGRTTGFLRQADYLAQQLATLRWLSERRTVPTFDDVRPGELPTPLPETATAQLRLLDRYLAAMGELEPRLVPLGATVPENGKRQVLRFLDLIRAVA
jgi:hypothetical protein